MSNKEILAIYKKAEKHWSRPEWLCWLIGWNHTGGGLCEYFNRKHRKYFLSHEWERLWLPYRTITGSYHFINRKERLEAIRYVIEDLENEQ